MYNICVLSIDRSLTACNDAGSEGIPSQDNFKVGADLLIRFGER
jgi:hypothetical protein